MRFLIPVFLLLCFLPGPGGRAWGAATPGEPEVTARAAVLADARTGQVLWARNPDLRAYPASTTKILTALVVVMRAGLGDEVRVAPEDTDAGGSAIWLRPGEVLSVEDLLYALLLNSANDAAEALARHVAGSDGDFARLLNDTALALGATNTHFTNPSGMPDSDHYTTARDLAIIARAALAHPVLRNIMATRTHQIRRQDPEAVNYLVNHNKLLWRYPGAIGMKTGYTAEAGQCLVAAAQRGERTLIAVVL
ncbi:MAG: D-alanyl-D-alanine carboxypeptidase, partial [Firmicutes bacterium]|nr:D-alanyl-D-alanine carboxypeptidase [Bacillota bacterium]